MEKMKLPSIALGTWSWGTGFAGGDQVFGNNLGVEELKLVFDEAMAGGLNLWDSAVVYGMGASESLLAAFTKERNREDVLISTKFTPQIAGDFANPVEDMLNSSLERFGTDYIDIYWIHNPADVERWTPFLADLVKSGKVKRVGVSNHNLAQIKRAEEILSKEGVHISAVQNHFSLLYRSSEKAGILDYCKENGIDFWAYMVLEQGALSGKYDTVHPLPAGSQRGDTYNPLLPQIEKLAADDDVKGLVLRVNSGGGSAFASEQIWKALEDFKAKDKPFYVSMGDYAASGGYYISCGADSIFADATTLTGSIGIFGMMYSGEKLFTETLGLNFDVVKTNKMADLGASLGPVLTRPLNASEQELMQNYVNRGYKLFVSRCAEGRKMTTEAIEKVAEGRVWTGAMAKDLGLVDELGGIDKALNAAATQAGIENYSIISYPEKENIFASLLGSQKKHYVNSGIKEYLGSYYNSFKALENIKDADCIQARMPFDPNIQ